MSDVSINTVPVAEDFNGKDSIQSVDEKGNKVTYVLLSNGLTIASIKEGKGSDVEKATVISGGDQSKYMSAMMSSTIQFNGNPVVMEDLADLNMKDYMKLQLSFAELNF